MKRRSSSLGALWLAGMCLLGTSMFVACSGTNESSKAGGDDDDTTSGSGGAGAGNSTGEGGLLLTGGGPTNSGGGQSTSAGGGCAGTNVKAEKVPLDMFIMLDQSGSMSDPVGNQTKWQAVTGAIAAFVQSPEAAGIGVGIQYFALPVNGMQCPARCMSDADCGACGPCFLFGPIGLCVGASGGDSCNPADYAKPEVPIAPLPGNAQAIIDSMAQHSPSTGTPTSASMQGGIDFAKQWQIQNPDHVVVHVYATDGDPQECDTNIANINAIAAAGYNGQPSIRTFVIGVGGSVQNLNGFAAAGGTGMAYIIDQNAQAQQQFLDALKDIQGTALPCAYAIPQPSMGMLDYGQVNVEYKPGDGSMPQTIKNVKDGDSCPPNGDGWYYDNNASPTQIVLCDSTCDKLSMDTMGQVDIVLGCETIVE